MKDEGYITEVFKSLQGEGIYLGTKQLFIRFSGCNLRCKFCDTTYALNKVNTCKVNLGYRKTTYLNNPVKITNLIGVMDKFKKDFHSVSLTGGEPLLQVRFIKKLLMVLKKKNIKVYLDTNGTLPQVLNEIINNVDIVAMDIKLPSSAGLKEFWKEHKNFLKVSKGKVFVKIVITKKTLAEDIKRAIKLVEEVSKKIPIVLQPEHRLSTKEFEKLFKFNPVRIIPQIHKYMGIR